MSELAFLSNGHPRPAIQSATWTAASTVLPDEARDFTPWLADNLELLTPVLHLADLTLIQREWSVQGFALDIRAAGSDIVTGETVTVVIENQYNRTDHRHLGQLITYAAQASSDPGKVLAVWISEHVHPAHVAAMEFLNDLASPDQLDVQFVLLQVRFSPAPNGYHVHFQSRVEPNSFKRQATVTSRAATVRATDAAREGRGRFLSAVEEVARPGLARMGLTASMDSRSHWLAVPLPPGLPLRQFANLRFRCSANSSFLGLYAEKPTVDNNALMDVLAARYDDALRARGLEIETWHAGQGYRRDLAKTTSPAGGYDGGNIQAAAEFMVRGIEVWLEVLSADPMTDVPNAVSQFALSDNSGDPE